MKTKVVLKEVTDDNIYFKKKIVENLAPLISNFEKKVYVVGILENENENEELSEKIKVFLNELDGLFLNVDVKIYKRGQEQKYNSYVTRYPAIIFLNDKKEYVGSQLHVVPGGHELNSFIIILYNLARKWENNTDKMIVQTKKIQKLYNIKIGVTLTCTYCQDIVSICQKISSLTNKVETEVYDIEYFPDFVQKYNIMNVPCIIINDEKVVYGKKNLSQIMELLVE